jgi:hypothetical protein
MPRGEELSRKSLLRYNFSLSWSQDYSASDKSYLVHFQTITQQSSVSEPANAPSTGMTFTVLFLKDEHWHLFLI